MPKHHRRRTSAPILYLSGTDLAAPGGAGVCEQERIRTIYEVSGVRPVAVVPRPSGDISHDVVGLIAYPAMHRHSWFGWTWHELCLFAVGLYVMLTRRPQRLLVHASVLPSAVTLLTKLARVPYDVTVGWGSTGPLEAQRGVLWRLVLAMHRLLLRSLCRRAECTEVVTSGTARYLASFLGMSESEFTVIRNGANIHVFRPAPRSGAHPADVPSGPVVIGYAGSHPLDRGAREIIHALATIRSEALFGLIVGASDAELTEIDACASRERVRDRLRVVTWVDYERVPSFMRAMSLGVALELPERMAVKGNSSQKTAQYLACGVPVLSVAPDNDFLVSHGIGWSIPPGDLEAFVDCVARWTSMSLSERSRMRARARAFAVEYMALDGPG